MIMLDRETVAVCGRSVVMTCTLAALLRFERATGYGLQSANGPAAVRTLLWALLADEQPRITPAEVGAMSATEAERAVKAALTLWAASAPLPDPDAPEAAGESGGRVDWYELWAIGRIDLGLSEAEFWGLSPAMYHAMTQRLEWRLYGHCITAAAITNCHIDREKAAPLSPLAFMPGRTGRAESRRITVQQGETLRMKMGGLRDTLLGGPPPKKT